MKQIQRIDRAMKLIFLSLSLSCIATTLPAQWNNTTNPPHIYTTNTGNVGIGATNPQVKLDIGTTQGNGLQLRHDATTAYRIQLVPYWNNFTDTRLDFNIGRTANQAPTTIMSVGYGNNVGIGTTSPAHLLQIHNSNNPTLAIGQLNQSTSGKSTLSFFAGTSTHQNGFFVQYNRDAASDRLGFVGGGGVEHMSILNSGNIGIGTIAPRGKFDVDGAGDIYLSDDLYAGSAQSIYIPGHIYMSPYNSSNVTYIQARRPDNSGSTSILFRTTNAGALVDAMLIANNGNIGIGTATTGTCKLAVEGKIGAREVNVLVGPWPDYVFQKNYNLPTLAEVETYINQNKHLPEVPAAKEMEKNGVNLGEMNMLLLKKVEELTLYVIELKKENELQHKQNEIQQKEIESIKKKLR